MLPPLALLCLIIVLLPRIIPHYSAQAVELAPQQVEEQESSQEEPQQDFEQAARQPAPWPLAVGRLEQLEEIDLAELNCPYIPAVQHVPAAPN